MTNAAACPTCRRRNAPTASACANCGHALPIDPRAALAARIVEIQHALNDAWADARNLGHGATAHCLSEALVDVYHAAQTLTR